MMYSGKIFKKIRTKKDFSTKQIADGLVTPQFINKYERGESDIRYSNLNQLLTRMHVTMNEFALEDEATFDYWLSKVETDIDELINNQNNLGMRRFIEENEEKYESTGENRFLFVSIVMKKYSNLRNNSVYAIEEGIIKEFLRETEYWGNFELFLLTNFRSAFDAEESFHYGNYLLSKKTTHSIVDVRRYDTILQLIYQLILTSELDLAKKLLDKYLDYPNPNRRLSFIHQDLFAKFLLGIYLVKTGDTSGEKLANEVVHIFENVLNYPSYADSLDVVVNRMITQQKNSEFLK